MTTDTLDEVAPAIKTSPQVRYSVEPSDPGYRPHQQIIKMGLAVEVLFEGKKADFVITADESGMIKRYVHEDGELRFDDDDNLITETVHGYVVCRVYGNEDTSFIA